MTDQYKSLDYLNVDELYSDEERMIRDTLRSWVSDKFMPIIEEHNRAATFPMELIPELGEMGVYGASLEGYGCAGLSPVAAGLIPVPFIAGVPTPEALMTMSRFI